MMLRVKRIKIPVRYLIFLFLFFFIQALYSQKQKIQCRNNVISFEYLALNCSSAKKTEYANMKEDLEKERNSTFHIKASNNGEWNEEGISPANQMTPPFWRTIWFHVLFSLAVILFLFGIYRLRIRQLKRRKEELERIVDLRTNQLQNLTRELEKLSIVASETDNSVIIMDAVGNFEWVNENFIKFSGYTLEQFISEKGKNLLDISSNPHVKEDINRSINNKQSIIYESVFETRSGSKLWTQTTLTPILNGEGKIKKLVAIYSDISKIKEAEKKISEQRDQLEQANQKLKQLEKVDGLTGIANYRSFDEFLSHEWKDSIRDATPISLILADVDFFKLYNDTYGHQAGDGCLKKIAQLLRTSINRAGDLAARYGGEEFIIVLSNTDTNGAAHISESIREGVKDLKIVHETSSVANYVTISLGCSTLYPQKGEDHTSLVKLADEALYMSKQKGRNQTTVINL